MSEPSEKPEIAVVAVTDDAATADPTEALTEAASANSARLQALLAELREGHSDTGVPAVDAAYQRLTEIDPTDLAGAADLLNDVLGQLEQALREQPER